MKRIVIVTVILALVGVGFFGCKNPSSWGKCLLTYDGNGADGGKAPFEPSEFDKNSLVNVAENCGTFTLNGKRFERWLSTLDGDGPTYYPGEAFLIGDDTTLYVDWVDSHGGIDTSFNLGGDADENINAVVEQTDGKVIVGGNFTTIGGVARNRIARLNPDGGVDTAFNPGSGFNGGVRDMVMQPNGLVLVAGDFSSFNGAPCGSVVRVNPDGSLDSSFNSASSVGSQTFSIALQSDGKILAGGWNTLTRVDAAGASDGGFTDGTVTEGAGAGLVEAIKVQPDGKILVGGRFDSYDSDTPTTVGNFLRILSNGAVDGSAYVVTANGLVSSIGVKSNGEILIAGDFSDINGSARNKIARFNSSLGLNDAVAGYGPNGPIRALTVLPDDYTLVAGWFTKFDASDAYGMVRLNEWNGIDGDFAMSRDAGGCNQVVLLKSGKILAATGNRIYRIWP